MLLVEKSRTLMVSLGISWVRQRVAIAARRLLSADQPSEAERIAAYLQGNCVICLTRPVAVELPQEAALCIGCAKDAGWDSCAQCEMFTLNWHAWNSLDHDCPIRVSFTFAPFAFNKSQDTVIVLCILCLQACNLKVSSGSPLLWDETACGCDRCE
jgi:hypothetical protein